VAPRNVRTFSSDEDEGGLAPFCTSDAPLDSSRLSGRVPAAVIRQTD
jgi:hypothetical protein